MMHTRRSFVAMKGMAGAACAGCGALTGRDGSWTAREIETIDATILRNGGSAWATWQGSRRIADRNAGMRQPALSITKSIAALAASRAVSEGWLRPSELVAHTINEWRGDSRKSRITVLMLLQQVSGLESGVIPLYRNRPSNKGRAAVALRCVDAPGTVFRYGPSHWELLAEVMRRKLAERQESLSSFMSRAVMHPLKLNHENWRSDSQGVPYFSTGTKLSATELGRLGAVISRLLRGEASKGFHPIPFAEVTRSSSINPMFGGGVWNNRNARRAGARAIMVERSIDDPRPSSFWKQACLATGQPADFVALIGSGGCRVYLWPNDQRSIARLGSSTSRNDVAFLNRLQNHVR